jgi:hypothetical protein
MSENGERDVVITDVRIPFLSMVVLLVKVAVAAIPAFLILSAIGALVSALFGLIFGGFQHVGPMGEP